MVLSKHYCTLELKSVSLFAMAASCHGEPEQPACPYHSQEDAPEDRDCCDTETDYLQMDDARLAVDLNQVLPGFAPALPARAWTPRDVTACGAAPADFPYRPPPPLVRDRQSWLQTYLC